MEGQPIVVKRVKKHVHGAHGGSWKVAFADFVTAMMAFFMVMWLMSSANPEQKAAISKYFNDPYGAGPEPSAIQGPGGASTNLIQSEGISGANDSSIQQLNAVQTKSDPGHSALEEMAKAQEQKRLEKLMEEIKKEIEANPQLAPFKDQLLLEITPEGLRIMIVDKENRAMFSMGSPNLENYTRTILHELGQAMNAVPNRISISGHTDATPYLTRNGYSNWELSADRANAARRELLAGGLAEQKIARVVGMSSSVPFDRANPLNHTNRRISIIVMTKEAEVAALKSEEATIPAPTNGAKPR
ncbi:MAG TPA: flagellar motor protein MotB [Methylococcaceae bacterium]|nr:flagellar motor protein MotB [Methylococcaceae bacterium]